MHLMPRTRQPGRVSSGARHIRECTKGLRMRKRPEFAKCRRAAGIVGENAASGTSSIVGEIAFTQSQYRAFIREHALHGNMIRTWLSAQAPADPTAGSVEGFASAPRPGASGVVSPQTHARMQMNRNGCLMNQKNGSRMRRCQHSRLTRLKPRLFSDTRAAQSRPKGFRADGEETPPGQTPDLAYPKCLTRPTDH